MRRQPVNRSPSSFDGSAFFNSDANGSEKEDFFGELSKFESFIERKSRLAGGNGPRGVNGAHINSQDVISPRSDDGMSFVSRKKHDNYANVVLEMKKKQSKSSSDHNGWHMHDETDWHEESWNSFGNTNHFQQQQQKQQQHQQKNQPQQQQQRFQWNHPTATNKSRNNILNPPSAPSISPPERTGRKLYRENPVVTAVSSNSTAPQAVVTNQRSRSTVRRTVDLQRKIAQTWVTQRHKDDDEVSDAGSAISSVFLGNSTTMPGSGSWGDEFRSFGSASFGSGELNGGGGAPGANGTQQNQKKGLDSLFNKKRFAQISSAVDMDAVSVASGTGSVAARRRAQAALKNNNSPHRPGGVSVPENIASLAQQINKNCAPIQPPPSNSAMGARRNMRMRMQNKSSSFGSNGSQQQSASSSVASGKLFPFKQDQHNFESSFNAFQLDSSVIDEEVNSALNELKLDHPEMDFAFNRLGSSHSRANSVDSSTSGFHSGGGGGGVGGIVSGGYTAESPLKHNFKKDVVKGRNSPITVGSIKTLTTKSVTVESSVDSTTNQNHNQHIVVPSLRINNHTGRPISSGTATFSSLGNINKPIISPNVISVVEQFSESVERCSESSSLTDTSDWHHGSGGAAGVTSGVAGGATNMFKDASKGSTFHKSKKIIRPGESIPENNVAGGSRSVPPVNASTGGDCSASDAEKETDLNVALVLPSIKDRISQFKNNAVATTPTQQSSTSPRFSQKIYSPVCSNKDEPAPPEKSSPFSGTGNNITPSFRRRNNELPPHAPTSGQSPPFQVKLRKTKNILEAVPDNTNDLKNSDKEVDTATSSPNPFLSQVTLRSTGNSWRDKQQERARDTSVDSDKCPQNLNKPATPASPTPSEEPKRKLTYREQQELLRKEQEEKQTDPTTVEEPKKDVAALIRERIARNKQQNNAGAPQSEKGSSELNVGAFRGNLKKTSFGNREISSPPNIKEPSEDSVISAGQRPSSQSNSHPHLIVENSVKYSSNEEENPRKSLNSMLANRFGTPAKQDEKKVEPIPDARSALMAEIGKSAEKVEVARVSDPRTALMAAISKRSVEKEEQPAADPRAALMAAISKRASSPPVDDDSEAEVLDPKEHLATMLQNRVAQTSGGADTASKVNAKNNLSAMLAKRAPPTDVKDAAVDSSAANGRPALKDDPEYEKYFKMLKVGMPLPVVQHAMTRDGLDPSIMECDHNKPAPAPKSEGVPLKDDPAYAKYFKMLKLGLPMGAVKNAMERDGLDSSIMDGDHNTPASSHVSDSPATKKRQKDTHRRTRLHWDTPVGKVKSNTVWALVNKDEELENIVIDETEFTKLFQAEIKASSAPAERSSSSARNVVQVIDPKRANNGGIILARLRMSYDDMAKAVEKIDETAMTSNQAQGIVEYMPTRDERKKLREYMKGGDGDSVSKFEKLCECEKFMVAMMTVKQSKRKLRALLFKLQFRGCIHDLAHDVFSIEKACDELSNSIRLRKLFGIVLNIGNRLNTAGPGEKRKAGAFTIKSLLKLNEAKAFDNKTTFLHYVVLVVQRNNEFLLDFKDDLPTTLKADKIFWDQCVNELEEVETQLENVRKLALHEAKSNKFIYSLPNKSKDGEDNDSDDLSIASMSLEDEVALLRSTKIGMFALSAIKKVSQLRERVDTARDKFCQLLEYFGEDGENSSMQPHELFEIISRFCRNFDVAREDVMRMEKEKKRVEKKEKNDENFQKVDDCSKSVKQTITPQQTPNPSGASIPKKNIMLRSSSFQPNLSNVLADLKRATTKVQSEINEICETPSHGPLQQSTHFSSSKTVKASAQHSAPQFSQNTSPSAHPTPPQCYNTASKIANDTPKHINDNPSKLGSKTSFKTKVQHTETLTPERSSPIPPQTFDNTRTHCVVIDAQQSSESISTPIQVSSSETSAEPNEISPQKTSIMSRRDRRERLRHRSSTPSSSEADSSTRVPPPVSNSTPTITVNEPAPNNAPKASPSPAPSNANARAAARDRYARHKKMMHQKHTSN